MSDEDERLRSPALQDVRGILLARERVERSRAEVDAIHRESVVRLQLALDAGRLGDWSWVAQTDVVTLSDRAASIFGVPPGEPITWLQMRELLHEDHRERARIAVEAALETHTDYDIEYRVARPSSGDCWIAARGRGTYTAGGAVVGMIGVVQDISARKAAEEGLRDQEQQLRAMFDQAAVGIAIAAMNGRFLEVNQKFVDILGYSHDELAQASFRDFTYPDDLRETNAQVEKLAAGVIEDYRLEKRYVRKDESVIWCLATVTLIKDEHGVPQRFVGVIEDITRRRKTEEALRHSEQFNRTIIESSRDCIKTLSLAGVVLWISDSGCKTLDVSGPDVVVGTDWVDFWTPEDRPAARAVVQRAARGEAASFIGSFPIAGQLRFWDVVLTPILGASGEPAMLLAVSREVTERVENESALREAAEERSKLLESERHARMQAERSSAIKDEFLAVLSHELRTPLSAILGWAHIMRHRAEQRSAGAASPADQGSAELLKGLEVIERNARMQTQLIEDLLDMSRISSGKMRLELQAVNPMGFIEAAVEMVRPAATAKEIRLELRLDREVGPVTGDASRLQQVVWNLLSNAIKFTPKQGQVQVLLERSPTWAEISVVDSGTGIRADFLGYVFERFRQADASTTRKHGGLGLGLSIVKQLVELHGGTVKAASEGEGLGSTFTVRLPLASDVVNAQPAEARPPSTPPPSFKSYDLSGLIVMVVDDEPDARSLIARVLDECGAEVLIAGRAQDALVMVEQTPPHVIVSDISMPDIDGFELLKRLRDDGGARVADVPVIALTAFARDEDRSRILGAGFSRHLTKPIDLSGLVATVAELSGRSA